MNTRSITENFARKYATGTVLDIGGGYGRYASLFSFLGLKYTVSDIDPRADFVENSHALQHDTDSFSTVISNQVLEHIPEPEQTVAEAFRVLKRKGYCLMTVPFMIGEHNDPSDYRRYTRQGLRALLEKKGFEVVECKSYGGIFSVFSEMIKFAFRNPYKEKRNPILRKLAYWGIIFLEKLDGESISEGNIFYANTYIIARKP